MDGLTTLLALRLNTCGPLKLAGLNVTSASMDSHLTLAAATHQAVAP